MSDFNEMYQKALELFNAQHGDKICHNARGIKMKLDKCDKCENRTNHMSGLCQECRKQKCKEKTCTAIVMKKNSRSFIPYCEKHKGRIRRVNDGYEI